MWIILFIMSFVLTFVIIYKMNKTKNDNISQSKSVKTKYILSESSNTFHRPDCPYVKKIDHWNLNTKHNSYSTLISIGCKPCKKCKPK